LEFEPPAATPTSWGSRIAATLGAGQVGELFHPRLRQQDPIEPIGMHLRQAADKASSGCAVTSY